MPIALSFVLQKVLTHVTLADDFFNLVTCLLDMRMHPLGGGGNQVLAGGLLARAN